MSRRLDPAIVPLAEALDQRASEGHLYTKLTGNRVKCSACAHRCTILPGLDISCEILHLRTAKLPHVAPAVPKNVFAKNTYDAIVNGVLYAAVGALREVVERFATELHSWPKLVITGGRAPLVAQVADFVDAHVPDLCLMGVALAYRKAAGQT